MKVPTVPHRSVAMDFTPPPRRQASVKLYNGSSKSSSHWDGLRRDSELWTDDGDCLVHFYSLGGSQRGPSLRLSYELVEACGSRYLLDDCLLHREASSPAGSDDATSDSGYASSQHSRIDPAMYELFIPAPADLTREQAYAYHITSRNFFAYLAKKPIVGEHLGPALAALLERIRQWQPKTAALANLMQYCEEQNYLSMAENADYALACLCLAEQARLKELWIESFVHCAGMHDQLCLSREYHSLSNTTKALITRSSLEMDLHTTRVTRALGTFLEDEMGAENLGLSKPARDHLDRFRSFLHNYYVDKLGYYPPSEKAPWNKRLWTKMYCSFQSLYEYLVDTESSLDSRNLRLVDGGICVAQNIEAFDQRHGYTPLPYALPLLPSMPTRQSRTADAQKGLRSLMLGKNELAAEHTPSSREALAQAVNADDDIVACELVQEYQGFERQKLEERLSVVEARKVRWLLIYGVLQMLISVTRAPKEVRNTEAATYPLCVLVAGGPDSEATRIHPRFSEEQEVTSTSQLKLDTLNHDDVDKLSIHPDCEADNAEDFFSAQSPARRASVLSFDLTPPPLRITTQISRTASLRSSVHSSVHALHKSFVGSLSRRNTIRKSVAESPLSKTSSYCEILIDGYGNGAEGLAEKDNQQAMWSTESLVQPQHTDAFAGFDFGLANVNEEPALEDFQLNRLSLDQKALPDVPLEELDEYEEEELDEYEEEDEDDYNTNIARVQSDSNFSALASDYTNSNRSSTFDCDSPATNLSSCDEMSRRNSGCKDEVSPVESTVESYASSLQKRHSYQHRHLNFGVRTSCFSVNAGCYVPTGAVGLPLSKFSQRREPSVDSKASSDYAEDSTQADEIEEEEMRGRRRSRALDRVRPEEMLTEGKRLSLEEV